MSGALTLFAAGFVATEATVPGGGTLAVSISPASSFASGPSGPNICPPVTAYVSGGSGSYTYAWTIDTLSFGGLTINAPTNRTTSFEYSILDAGVAGDAIVQVAVTDAVTGETGAALAGVAYART